MFEHDDHDLDSFLWLKETENKKKLLEIIKKFDLAITDIDIIETEFDLALYIQEDQNIPQEIKAKLKQKREEELKRRKEAGESLEELVVRKAIQEMIDTEM